MHYSEKDQSTASLILTTQIIYQHSNLGTWICKNQPICGIFLPIWTIFFQDSCYQYAIYRAETSSKTQLIPGDDVKLLTDSLGAITEHITFMLSSLLIQQFPLALVRKS